MRNRWDRKKRSGFTIVEIMIFLAISGILIVGVMAGSGVIVARHRYNDSVQNLAQLLRAQYSAVINIHIAERTPGERMACLSPSLDAILDGNTSITVTNFQRFFDDSGNLKAGVDDGRGRNNCLVYGSVITFGGDGGRAIQVSPLIGLDIMTIDADPRLTDLQLLRLSGVNNLRIDIDGTVNASGTGFNNLECHVRTARGSSTHNLEWGANIQDTEHDTLQATLIIFRSPKDGAIRTWVHHGPFLHNGVAIDFSAIDGANIGLKDPGDSSCGGNLTGGSLDSGYSFYRQGSLNESLPVPDPDDPDAAGTHAFAQDDLFLCIDSDDLFALNGQRRMIRIRADGRNASAVELIDLDRPAFGADGVTIIDNGGNRCR